MRSIKWKKKKVSGRAELPYINAGLHSSGINTAMDWKPRWQRCLDDWALVSSLETVLYLWNHPSDLVRMRYDLLFFSLDCRNGNVNFGILADSSMFNWGQNTASHFQICSLNWRCFPWICVFVPGWMDATWAPVESQTAWKPKSLLLLGFWFRLILISQWFSWTTHISTASK